MSEDKTQVKNLLVPVSNPSEVAAPLGTVVPGPVVENLAVPTHTEVPVSQPLRDIGITRIPVAKLPDTEDMQPTPPNFSSIGDMTLPVGIIDINDARRKRRTSVNEGPAWVGTEVIRQQDKLEAA